MMVNESVNESTPNITTTLVVVTGVVVIVVVRLYL